MEDKVSISKKILSEWVEELLRINHLATLIPREIDSGDLERAKDLSERSRKRAWTVLNSLFDNGADRPEGVEFNESK